MISYMTDSGRIVVDFWEREKKEMKWGFSSVAEEEAALLYFGFLLPPVYAVLLLSNDKQRIDYLTRLYLVLPT